MGLGSIIYVGDPKKEDWFYFSFISTFERDESFNYANEVKPGKKERDEKSSKFF